VTVNGRSAAAFAEAHTDTPVFGPLTAQRQSKLQRVLRGSLDASGDIRPLADLAQLPLADGAALPSSAGAMNFQLSAPERGTHTITATVLSADGQTLCSAPAVSFSVQRPSLNSPQSPAKGH